MAKAQKGTLLKTKISTRTAVLITTGVIMAGALAYAAVTMTTGRIAITSNMPNAGFTLAGTHYAAGTNGIKVFNTASVNPYSFACDNVNGFTVVANPANATLPPGGALEFSCIYTATTPEGAVKLLSGKISFFSNIPFAGFTLAGTHYAADSNGNRVFDVATANPYTFSCDNINGYTVTAYPTSATLNRGGSLTFSCTYIPSKYGSPYTAPYTAPYTSPYVPPYIPPYTTPYTTVTTPGSIGIKSISIYGKDSNRLIGTYNLSDIKNGKNFAIEKIIGTNGKYMGYGDVTFSWSVASSARTTSYFSPAISQEFYTTFYAIKPYCSIINSWSKTRYTITVNATINSNGRSTARVIGGGNIGAQSMSDFAYIDVYMCR